MYQRFHVHTDHKNLIQLLNKAQNFKTGKLYRWCQRVQDLDFDCHFISGLENRFADYLSRNGLYIDTVPASVVDTKLESRDIVQAYHAVLIAEILGMSGPRRDMLVEQSVGADAARLSLPDIDAVVRAAPVPHVTVPRAPRSPNHYERRRRRRRARDAIDDTLRHSSLKPVLPYMGDEEMEEVREWNRWLIENRPLDAPQPIYAPPPDSDVLDFYNPKTWTDALIKEKQGEDTFCVLVTTFLRTGARRDLLNVPPYWRRPIIDGRFVLDPNSQILRYRADDGISGLIVVPWQLRGSLLRASHEDHLHDGGERMAQCISVNYFWPKMRVHVREYIAGCTACARVKHDATATKGRGRLKLFSMKQPFAMISIDIVGPMPVDSNGNRYIVSIIDRFTRFVRFVPVQSIRTIDILHALEEWTSIFGSPRIILSDNGPQFTSHMFEDAMGCQGIECRTTSTYHPECNGMVERVHRWLKERLALIAHDAGLNFVKRDDWSPYLRLIAFAYNTTPNRMTSHAPSELVLGFNPTSLTRFDAAKMWRDTPEKYVEWLTRRMALLRGRAVQAQKHYDIVRKRGYDKPDTGDQFEVGSAVMYDASGPRTGNEKKLLPDYMGPYEVIEIAHDGQSYKLRCVADTTVEFRAPRKHLKAYNGRICKSPIVAFLDRQHELFVLNGQSRSSADAKAARDAVRLVIGNTIASRSIEESMAAKDADRGQIGNTIASDIIVRHDRSQKQQQQKDGRLQSH